MRSAYCTPRWCCWSCPAANAVARLRKYGAVSCGFKVWNKPFSDIRGKYSYMYAVYMCICVNRDFGESWAGVWRRGNKQILLNDRDDEQSAYLQALEDFCLLPVRIPNMAQRGKQTKQFGPVPPCNQNTVKIRRSLVSACVFVKDSLTRMYQFTFADVCWSLLINQTKIH